MNTPLIIVSESAPGQYQISVSGRFGGGFSGVRKSREGLIGMLGNLKAYDCGKAPASVICPASVEPEFRKVFPKSF